MDGSLTGKCSLAAAPLVHLKSQENRRKALIGVSQKSDTPRSVGEVDPPAKSSSFSNRNEKFRE